MIIIDDREHEISKCLTNDCKIDRLDIGDFHIYNESGLCMIIERKTVDDYIESKIVDGRLSEQLLAFEKIKGSVPIVFLIENYKEFDGEKHGMSFQSFDKSLSHLIFNGYLVVKTINMTATIKWLVKMNEFSKDVKGEIVCTKKNKSKDIFISQLMGIPGISKKIAESIKLRYKNYPEMIKGFDNEGLTGIKCGKKTISKKRSDAIKLMIFGG